MLCSVMFSQTGLVMYGHGKFEFCIVASCQVRYAMLGWVMNEVCCVPDWLDFVKADTLGFGHCGMFRHGKLVWVTSGHVRRVKLRWGSSKLGSVILRHVMSDALSSGGLSYVPFCSVVSCWVTSDLFGFVTFRWVAFSLVESGHVRRGSECLGMLGCVLLGQKRCDLLS